MGVNEPTESRTSRVFSAVTAVLHALMPGPLRRIVPQTFIGFAIINSSTYLLDVSMLSYLVRAAHWPYQGAVSVSFATAASVAFLLNKFLNFRVQGDVGRQGGRYGLVIVTNFLIWVLGFSSLLNALGIPPEISRVLAGLCEGLYIYLLSRLWVFRGRQGHLSGRAV